MSNHIKYLHIIVKPSVIALSTGYIVMIGRRPLLSNFIKEGIKKILVVKSIKSLIGFDTSNTIYLKL